jgi:hypothetical protein
MTSTSTSKTKAGHVVLSVIISSTFLLAIVLEDQNIYALSSLDRYTSGFSHGEQHAATDFQNNIPFNPVCVEHTSYYCAGYVKGYNVTWNNLVTNRQTSNPGPNPPASNSTTPLLPASNSNATTPPTIIPQPSTYSWVAFIVFLIILIAAIVWKLKDKSGKHKERHHFPDRLKEKVLEKQHHRCADCNKVLDVIDWHHRNGDRSDNRESNCVALCPNCHAIKTRRH